MFKVSHKTLISISGSVWIGIGLFLLQLGLGLLLNAIRSQLLQTETALPIMSTLSGIAEIKFAALILVMLSLILGFFKGRFVLHRTVMRSVARIKNLPDPTTLLNLYSKGNILLIVGMMGLGMLMRSLNVPSDVRAFIDIAVGSALIHGGILYFRTVFFTDTKKSVGGI